MTSFHQRATLSNGRKKAIQPVPCVMRNLKHWNMSSVPVRRLLLTEDTLGDTTVYWMNWSELYGTCWCLRQISQPRNLLLSGGKHVGSKKSTYHQAIPGQNLLGLGVNWKVSAGLPGWHNGYPKIISSKGLRPDIVLFLKENSKDIQVELTIPFESQLEQSHDYKTSKYEDLKKELEKEGYSLIIKAVEIGARGFIAGTLYQFLGQIGINQRNRSKSMKCLTEITENCSMWIWNKRNILWNISK